MWRLVVAGLVVAQATGQQDPDDTWWEDSMGSHYCPGGQAWSTTREACVACPEGKQSRHNSTMPCSFCPQTLRPNSNQSGCVCQPLHFNTWERSAGAHNELLQCTPCADVLVALAEGDESDEARAGVGKVPCLPCADASSSSCSEGVHCECAGGPKGEARLCPVDGFWLEYRGQLPAPTAAFDTDEEMPTDRQTRAAMFEMLECKVPRVGASTKCLHWSRCLAEADTGQEDDDPPEVQRALDAGISSVYVSDHECLLQSIYILPLSLCVCVCLSVSLCVPVSLCVLPVSLCPCVSLCVSVRLCVAYICLWAAQVRSMESDGGSRAAHAIKAHVWRGQLVAVPVCLTNTCSLATHLLIKVS